MRAHAYIVTQVRQGIEMDKVLTLFDLIGVLARRRYQAAERHFSALGLNHTEARLLTLLEQAQGEASQDDLSSLLYVDRSNAGRALKRLEQERYVERGRHDSDKRKNLVRITDKGREAVAEVARLKLTIARSVLGGLDEREVSMLLTLLTKVCSEDHNAEPI